MSFQKPKHIFIVEDNEIYGMMLGYILSKDSIYKFVSFKSGEECLENLYLNPEIIILDYGLPGINGLETLVQIKLKDPNIHVVILTSHDDAKLKEELLKAGADELILKQGRGESQIIASIENILSKDALESRNDWGIKNKVLYVILIAILITLGVAYYI